MKKLTNRFWAIIILMVLFGLFSYMLGYISGISEARNLFDLHLEVMRLSSKIKLNIPI